MSDKKLSDIDIAVALERFSGAMEAMQESQVRIESALGDLPCGDLSDRIVRLEEARVNQEKLNDSFETGISGAFKIARDAKQETFNKFWKIGVILFGGGIGLVNAILLYLVTRT
jgi:hypothetical protein